MGVSLRQVLSQMDIRREERRCADMMMSNCLRLPFASTSVSPRSTRKTTLSQCETVMLVLACLVVKWMLVEQSGTWT